MKNLKTLLLVALLVALVTVSPAQLSQDTLNGWHIVGSYNCTVDTAYTYLNPSSKVQGRSSQAFGYSISGVAQADSHAIVWEKDFGSFYPKPDSFIFWVKRGGGIQAPIFAFYLVNELTNEPVFFIALGQSENTWSRVVSYNEVPLDSFKRVQIHFLLDPWGSLSGDATAFFDSLTFKYGSTEVSVDMFELPPYLATSTDTLSFDNVQVGCMLTQTLVMKRDDASPLALTLASISTSNSAFSITQDTGSIQTSSSELSLQVTFAPIDTGLYTGSLTFIHDGDNSPFAVELTGRGGGLPDSTVLIDPQLGTGWQLISMPLISSSSSTCQSFQPLFEYATGYKSADMLETGKGYWYKAQSPPAFTGYLLEAETVFVMPKWNIIGSISTPVAVGDLFVSPPGITLSSFFGYSNAGYAIADTIFPGRGYWVKVSEPGVIRIGTPVFDAMGFRQPTIVHDHELPPPPPGETMQEAEQLPKTVHLLQNYPNPFNPSTVISYELPVTGDVSLSIFNLLGEEVATLVNERKEAGSYSVTWDGSRSPSGVYFYRLQAGAFTQTRKLLLVQ